MKIKLIILLNLITFTSFSQLGNRDNFDVKSPNVSDFMRYGNIPTKMYVGELDFNLPVISIPIPNQYPINISLSYNASGFIPNKRSGLVGLNWNLIGIGSVSREVNGCPDDHVGAPTTSNGINGRYAHGFMVGIKYLKDVGATLPNGNPNDFISALNNQGDQYLQLRYKGANGDLNNSFETTPDVFHFNVNTISGKFFQGNDGKIKVVSDTPNIIDVDLSNFNFQPYTTICTPINFSEIKITDDLGNKYFFGGESKYLEYTLQLQVTSSATESQGSQPVINTWFLKKIEYANGEIINYNYQDDSFGAGLNFCRYESFFHAPYTNLESRKFVFMNVNANDTRVMENSGGITNSTGGFGNSYTLHKKAFLDNISSENFQVKFNYSSHGFIFNNDSNIQSIYKNFYEFKLDSIVLKDNAQNQINKIDFTYLIKGGTNAVNSFPRLFLDKVTENGKPPYTFEYDILPNQTLPKASTCAIDFYGFYNGKLTNDAPPFGYSQLIPQSTVDSNGDFTYTTDIRNPNFSFAKIGMLKKVNYPTGGYSLFEFEPHTYSKRLERKSSSNFLPQLFSANGQVGGIRIKKITDYDGVYNTNVKEYSYLNADGTSSGISMQWPRTQFVYNFHNSGSGWSGVGWWSFSVNVSRGIIQSSALNLNTVENSAINYSRVIEKSIGNGYSIYNFKDYVNYPDIDDITNNQLTAGTYSPETMVKNIDAMYNDRSIERGKLESKEIYDENNIIKVKEEYLYNTDPNRFLLHNVFVGYSHAWWQRCKKYYYNDFLTETKKTLYTTTGNIVSTEKNIYNAAPAYNLWMTNQYLLTKKNTLSSISNELIETEYNYPWDIYSIGSVKYNNFKISNIGIPIKITEYKTGEKLNQQFLEYSKDITTNNLLLPKDVYNAKFPNDFTDIPSIGQLEKLMMYDLYDNKGNVIQYSKSNGISVVLLWGYNKTQLIAKIENATYTAVQAYEANLQNISNTGTEANLISALNSLRTALPNAMITTYTHKPLIGVSSVTDTKGNIQTYHYDSFNRLQFVKDKDGNILSENEYNYKN